MRKISWAAAGALMLLSAAVTVSLTYTYAMDRFNQKVSDVNEREAQYHKLSEIDEQVRNRFVGQVDDSTLRDGLCAGYAAGLSNANVRYMTAEKYADYEASHQRTSVGVGINTVMDSDGNMEIVEVYTGSSAQTAGLQKGDVIVAMDGKEVSRIGYVDAVSLLDGADGSELKMTVLRPGEEESETLSFTVQRTAYTAASVSHQRINGNVGYIRISMFAANSYTAFENALTDLEADGELCGLVIDLRGNSDTRTEQMEKIADRLLPAGEIIRTVDKNGETAQSILSDARSVSIPVTVIVDSGTSGAAEVLASALHDAEYETVGSDTAGTAQVTEVALLSDGSALFLPTQNYVNQSGEVLYGTGVKADIPIQVGEAENEAFLRRQLNPQEDSLVQSAVTRLIAKDADVQEVPEIPTEKPESSGDESELEESR